MNILAALVLGLLIGWLIEWVIDWFYWRGRLNAAVQATTTENEKLSEQNLELVRTNKNLDEANSTLQERAAALQAEIDQLKAAALVGDLLDEKGNHNFQAIKGIGPAFSERLKKAGIKTFDQLAQLTSEDMEKILGTLYKRFFSKKNTILDQAKEFAKHIAVSQGRRDA
jgi:predicted flap endonuclease-1-like 5' DNA nuclease